MALNYDENSRAMLDKILMAWPLVTRERWKERILYNCEKIAALKNLEIITSETLLQAAQEVAPKSYEPLFLKLREPDVFAKVIQETRQQETLAPKDLPVRIKRWETPYSGKKEVLNKNPEEMKVIAFCGSPRVGGNTDVLIEQLLNGAQSRGAKTEKVMLHKKKIGYCTGCRMCRKGDVSTICVIKDDMTPLYDKIYGSDCIVVGFPIYTARESAQTSVFFDRLDCLANPYLTRKVPDGKRAAVIGTWQWPGEETYAFILEGHATLLKLHYMEPVEIISASGCKGKNYGRGAVANDLKGMEDVFQAGEKLVCG
ncbi:MAG: hypothetical protein A2043_00910 [Candidatus Schekmanbacteria bacterium GWA2_38_9]|uniref:NADPH-dependent FMN reductase-like domain-containing protein n=1 Tax=Candidatus Schekmanbacteria bacterium RIFCSPLOWO2_12_FULL_38_15 TaxID=1817883 RepID=A0A1F7SGE6_9BACT|nr:MAG: hypothetical protein A2043_00910 [Candidatus Schekmanbacteria bacterium GWA2_38_9]OGL51626.1 MAG: hypothetical protein A3H37_02535 [Candidatus Schekmanbacteria bacterium RIFCSPLOWO2_02_FULL_38_14]OGL52873.1 MAG: hypothetical protein A3G31_00565 [Candidatus Schekmanbacteria bacterium RIFCSPLOWO2_12_FULL_38_15]